MRVWEAQQILEGMDPQAEVTLTIGLQRQVSKEPWPYREHVGTPFYRVYHDFVPTVPYKFSEVTCVVH